MRIFKPVMFGLSLLLAPLAARAQDYPNRQIRLIVPFPAGGPNDIIARLVGQRMSELFKQTIIIDNRSGQAGVLGTDVVAKAAPDGYTIGIVSASSLVMYLSIGWRRVTTPTSRAANADLFEMPTMTANQINAAPPTMKFPRKLSSDILVSRRTSSPVASVFST